ncbi:YwiC-like family protein [Corynebacterium sp. 335C]
MAKANGKVRKKRRAKGWVPDQHGAWFMVTVPVLTGVLLAPAWIQLPLLVTWWAGYFAFFAAGIWMRSRFRANNRPPVVAYGSVTAVAGVVTLLLDWRLLVWAPAFAPLVAIAVYETWRRRPRSLLSGVATVIAACLMLPVMAWAGGGLDARAWLIFAVYAVYFTGTVPYVKTLIRERGDRDWFIGSVAYHVAAVVAAVFLDWVMVALAVVLAARAFAMPVAADRRGKPFRPKTVGLIEAALTVVIAVAAWFTLG